MTRTKIVFFILGLSVGVCNSNARGDVRVHFDQDVYTVTGANQTIPIQVLIDADDNTVRDDPVRGGLYSYGVQFAFPSAKAEVSGPADVDIADPLDFFFFGPGATLDVLPGRVDTHGNIDQFQEPLVPYSGTLLFEVELTNLAPATDSYLLTLDFFRDLGPTEQLFLDGTGTVLDPQIVFGTARVNVVPEPTALVVAGGLLLGLFGSHRKRHRA